EYIEGCDLKQYVESGYYLSEEQLLFWLRQLAEVLEYLHSRRPPIIHSDIKPENIMITTEGNVCLIDFNVALSGEGQNPKGVSVYYASPEQIAAAFPSTRANLDENYTLDGRSDIYSLGLTFYYLMTGYQPNALSLDYPPLESFGLDYSEGLQGIISRMTAADRRDRYQSASRLLYAIDHVKAQGKRYHRLQIIRNAAIGIYAVGMAIFIMLTIRGVGLQRTDSFLTEYQKMLSEYESGDSDESLELGLGMLNNSSYASVRKANDDACAEIYELIGVIYAEMGDYGTACSYYKEAYEYGQVDGSFYKSYAMALVRAGYLSEADRLLEEAQQDNAADADIAYIKAQLSWVQGDYGEAYEYLKSAVTLMGSGLSNREKRQLAYFAYELANGLSDEDGQSYLLETAESLYASLVDGGYAGWNDYYNLAVVYETDEKYEDGVNILLALLGESIWEEDYRAYAHLAVMSYRVAAEQGAEDYTKIEEYCETAIRLAEESGAQDDYLDVVENVLERVS
ncbi:MAG: protein kinase, partial [Clostridiales bacterium]|nr:protein kinase [Clostridiales bacterium]